MRGKRNYMWIGGLAMLAGLGVFLWIRYGHLWTDRYGAEWGLFAGVVVGALVLPIVRDPTVSGRVLLGAIAGLIVMGIYQLLQFNNLVQGMPGLVPPSEMATLGQFGLTTAIYLAYGIAGGIFLVLLFNAPQWVLVGGLSGVVVGAVVGTATHALLEYQGVGLSQDLFLVIVGLLTLALYAMFGLGSD